MHVKQASARFSSDDLANIVSSMMAETWVENGREGNSITGISGELFFRK
jgi:hypothetical protein